MDSAVYVFFLASRRRVFYSSVVAIRETYVHKTFNFFFFVPFSFGFCFLSVLFFKWCLFLRCGIWFFLFITPVCFCFDILYKTYDRWDTYIQLCSDSFYVIYSRCISIHQFWQSNRNENNCSVFFWHSRSKIGVHDFIADNRTVSVGKNRNPNRVSSGSKWISPSLIFWLSNWAVLLLLSQIIFRCMLFGNWLRFHISFFYRVEIKNRTLNQTLTCFKDPSLNQHCF